MVKAFQQIQTKALYLDETFNHDFTRIFEYLAREVCFFFIIKESKRVYKDRNYYFKIKNVEDYEDYLLQIHNESTQKRNNNITEVNHKFF